MLIIFKSIVWTKTSLLGKKYEYLQYSTLYYIIPYYIIFHVVYHSNYIIEEYNTGALALMGCFQFPLIITAIFHC